MTTTTTHKAGGAQGGNQHGAYKVRYASPKQQMFLTTLLDTKEHSFGTIDVSTLNVQGAGDLITQLLKLPNKAGFVSKPSSKQLSFATSLIQKKQDGLATLNHYLFNRKVKTLEELSRADVSSIINTLVTAKDIELPIKITTNDVGAYLVDETIYSIREGKQSGKLQVWSYNAGAEKYLRVNNADEKEVLTKVEPTDKLTLEKAIKYSAQTGICCHCGRTLTQLKSVAGGIGPICAKRYR